MPDFETDFRPVLEEIERRASVAGRFVDKDLYRIYIATLWANMVMDPSDAGLTEDDLEPLHDYLNGVIERILGAGQTLTECFRFLNTKAGELAMGRTRMTSTHRDLLTYFCSMILDPDGHRKWAESIAD